MAEVLRPLISLLAEEPSDDNPVSLDEISNIPILPKVDPAVAAIYYVSADDDEPVVERLEQLLMIAGFPKGIPGEEPPVHLTIGPLITPIRFWLNRRSEGSFGRLVSEYYLMAEIETESGDLVTAARQVALLVERLNQDKSQGSAS